MNIQKIPKNKGFTIIELMAAILILSFGIILVYSVFSNIIILTNSVSSRLTAIYLAQEGMEIIRNIRDDNFINSKPWKNGLTGCNNGCQADYKAGTASENQINRLKHYQHGSFLKINSDGFYGYDAGTDTPYRRKITIESVSNSILKVNVLVIWDYSGKSFDYETEGYLYNWY